MKHIKYFKLFENNDADYLKSLFIDLTEEEGLELDVIHKDDYDYYIPHEYTLSIYSKENELKEVDDLQSKVVNKIKQVLSVNEHLKLNKIIVYFDTLDLDSGRYVRGFSEDIWNSIYFEDIESFEKDSLLRLKPNNYYDVLETGMNEWIEEMKYKGNIHGEYQFIKNIQFEEPLEIIVSEKDLSTDVRMNIKMIEIHLK